MESLEASVRYVVFTKVTKLFQDKTGWFAQFEGSWESLYFGADKPSFIEGEAIRITIEKAHMHAKSIQTPK